MKQTIGNLNVENEAFTPGRAWSGKLKNIDKLLSWMYDKDILNKRDKKQKNTKFYRYYRWYNDGDFPKGLKGLKKYVSSKEEIEIALEKDITDFIKAVLSKYSGKYNRQEFHIDTFISDLKTLNSIIKDENIYGLLSYWGNTIDPKNSEFVTLLKDLKAPYDKFNAKINDIIDKSNAWENELGFVAPNKNKTLSYRMNALKEKGLWTSSLQKEYDNKIGSKLDKMGRIITNLISAIEILKKDI